MLKFLPQTRILLVRTDNVGDVLLTTPALNALRAKYPKAFIGYLCRWYTAPLLQNNPAINQVLMVDDAFPFGPIGKIKDLKFDVSIHFYLDPRSTVMTAMAKIPRRIGPRSKIWAGLLTDPIEQNRSDVQKHEAEYNLDLAEYCGATPLKLPPSIFLTPIERREGGQILSRACGVPDAKPVVIHPGTGGHVETWPVGHFVELAEKIANRGDHVLFTAGLGESKIIEQVMKLKHRNVHSIPAASLSLRQLACVIAASRMFIGNSSGPLHIASAVGVPTISFFPKSPLVTSARRWGPYGNMKQNRIISPTREDQPLSSVTPDLALEWVINVLQSKQSLGAPGEGPMIG